MEDLRECPCCGKEAQGKEVYNPGRNQGFMRGWVGCPACGLYIQWTHDPAWAIRKWNRRADSIQPNMRLIDANALYRTAVNRAEKRGQYFNEMDRVISPKDIEDAPTIIPSAKAAVPHQSPAATASPRGSRAAAAGVTSPPASPVPLPFQGRQGRGRREA